MAASPNALAQGLQGYNFMLTPQANAQMRSLQQEQALADALRQQGSEPLSTNNRQIGGVGYAISPMEGAAKIAQQLVGAYGNYDANNKFNSMMNPQPDATPAPAPQDDGSSGGGITSQASYPGDTPQQQPPEVGAPGFAQMPDPAQAQQQPQQPQSLQGPFSPAFTGALQDIQKKYNVSPMVALQILQDPSALARVVAANAPTPEMKNAQAAYGDAGAGGAIRNIMNNQQFPGQKSMQEGLGTAAAAQAPAGTPPAGPGALPGLPGMPQQAPASFPPPMSGYSISNDGIHLPAPAPPVTGGGLPPGANSTLQNAVTPLNTAGMTNAQVAEATKAQGAGAAAQAEQTGKNVAEANKGVASIDSRIDNAKAIIQEMKSLAPQVPYGPHGMADAQVDFSNTPIIGNGKAAAAHDRFEMLNQNLFTQELPAIVQSSGGRIDIPLVKAIQAASSVPIDAHPYAKAQALDTLSTLLDKVQQNAKNYQGSLTGQQPAQGAPKTTNWTFQNGKLVPAQ